MPPLRRPIRQPVRPMATPSGAAVLNRTVRAPRFLQAAAAAVVLSLAPVWLAAAPPPRHAGPARRTATAHFDNLVREVMHRPPDMRDWAPTRRAAYERSLREPVGAPLAVLVIPRIGLSVPVLPRDDDRSLDRGVSHVGGTALPEKHGNVAIAGHRDGYFRPLERMHAGDVLRLATPSGVREYRMADKRIVKPEDVQVLAPTERDALTLVTCYPFYYRGHAPERFILRAYAVAARFDRRSAVPKRAE